jgi:glucosamine--fructose-6-phosphate aminotransferase (isomerizing)
LEEEVAQIAGIAQRYAAAPNVYVLGSGPNAGTTEGASLKVVEMAKLPSEVQDLENFLHGRLREVDRTTPLLFVAPCGLSSRRVLDFLTVTDHVGAPSVVLTDHLSAGGQRLATPLLYITPLYLLAYHLAHHRGYDPVARRYPDIVPQKVRYGGVLDKQPG